MSLDEAFGELIEAKPCAVEELESKPESLIRLDDENAEALKAFMADLVSGLSLVHYVYAQTPILWAVDESGDIWLALEEIVTKHSRRYLRPRIRGLNPAADETRLGHPALVGKFGRIGGELVYDLGWNFLRPGWKITNSSGRFGFDCNRTSEQLKNVKERFQEFDINVEAVFLG